MLVGAVAGVWFEHNPMIGALVGIAVAIVLGVVIDRVHAHREARRAERAVQPAELVEVSRG